MINELPGSDSAVMSAYVACAGGHELPKVLALDEHQILLDTMDAMFSGRFQFKGVTTHLEFMYALEMFQPDVIVMDVTVQGRDGISFVEKLRASRKNLRVIFLSQHDDPRCVAMAS